MRFENRVEKFLSGEDFSSGLSAKFIGNVTYVGRIEKLIDVTSGKKIIHVGCADHINLIEKKMKEGVWLHSILEKAATKIIGVDVNHNAIEYLKNLGIDNVFELNIISDSLPKYIKNERWDYLILGEIIEHLDNPVQFLTQINRKFNLYVDEIIITAPNAFRWFNVLSSLKSLELINTDHRYWFTPFTLAKVVTRSGMIPGDFYFVHSFPTRNPIKKLFYKMFPAFSDTIILRSFLKK